MIYNVKYLKCSLWVLAFLSPSLSSLTIFDILWCAWIPLREQPNFPSKPEHAVFGGKGQISPMTPLLTTINGRCIKKRCCGKACGAGTTFSYVLYILLDSWATSSRTKSKGRFSQKVTAQRRSWLSHWPFPPKASMEASPQMKTDNPIWVEKPQFKGKSISAYSSYSWPPESRVARSSHFILLIIPFAK